MNQCIEGCKRQRLLFAPNLAQCQAKLMNAHRVRRAGSAPKPSRTFATWVARSTSSDRGRDARERRHHPEELHQHLAKRVFPVARRAKSEGEPGEEHAQTSPSQRPKKRRRFRAVRRPDKSSQASRASSPYSSPSACPHSSPCTRAPRGAAGARRPIAGFACRPRAPPRSPRRRDAGSRSTSGRRRCRGVALAIMSAPWRASPPLIRCHPASMRSCGRPVRRGTRTLAEAAVVCSRRRFVHAAEKSVAKGRAAEAIAVVVDVEDVAPSQLVEEHEDAAVIGLAERAAAELERRLLAAAGSGTRRVHARLRQTWQPDKEGVLEGRRQLGVRAVRGKGPDSVDVTDDLLGHELAQDLDAMKRAAGRSIVEPIRESLHVGRVAEERADELERLRRRQARQRDPRAQGTKADQARRVARLPPLALADHEQTGWLPASLASPTSKPRLASSASSTLSTSMTSGLVRLTWTNHPSSMPSSSRTGGKAKPRAPTRLPRARSTCWPTTALRRPARAPGWRRGSASRSPEPLLERRPASVSASARAVP